MQHTLPHLIAVIEAKRLTALAEPLELDRLGIADDRCHDPKRSAAL
jgi:hypothetical protein